MIAGALILGVCVFPLYVGLNSRVCATQFFEMCSCESHVVLYLDFPLHAWSKSADGRLGNPAAAGQGISTLGELKGC